MTALPRSMVEVSSLVYILQQCVNWLFNLTSEPTAPKGSNFLYSIRIFRCVSDALEVCFETFDSF